MPRLNTEIKQQIKELPKLQLEEIVLKMAAKDKMFLDFLQVNYLDKENGEKELFENAKSDLDIIFTKRYRGFSQELQMANMLSACTKRINDFTKASKNKKLEADLILYVLEIPFTNPTSLLGTCFTQYDYKVGLLVQRLISIVTTKLHFDYKIDYQDKINQFLALLHHNSNHLDFIYNLPEKIE